MQSSENAKVNLVEVEVAPVAAGINVGLISDVVSERKTKTLRTN